MLTYYLIFDEARYTSRAFFPVKRSLPTQTISPFRCAQSARQKALQERLVEEIRQMPSEGNPHQALV
jgi:hypothetical protein